MHLNLIGYDARRVIRTRAVGGYESDVVPDVIAVKDGIEYTFESKYRKNGYQTIYRLYERERCGQNVCRFHIGTKLVVIGSDFEEVRKTGDIHFRALVPLRGQDAKIYQGLLNLEKLLKGAMYLVVKDNGKYPLFIRFS
jgi:hypothetical protein